MSGAGKVPLLPKPEEWGPKFWYMLDTIALGYGDRPNKHLKRSANLFLHSLKDLLPCPECRQHYGELLHERPPLQHLNNSTQLSQWILWVKEEINKKVKTKTNIISPVTAITATTYANVEPVERRNVQKTAATAAPRPVDRSAGLVAQNPKATIRRAPVQTRPVRKNPGPVTIQKPGGGGGLTNAQKRLKASAKYYKRPCSCY
jgi:hypothetical protein